MVQPAITLTDEQHAELIEARDHHALPYVREHAAAVIKVADGFTYEEVARARLLRAHDADTVSDWCKRYLAEGIDGLLIRKGRGRKPAFSPSDKGRSRRSG